MTVTGAFFSSKVICYRSPWTNRTSLLMGSNFLLSVILLEKVLISQAFIEPSTLVLTCSHGQVRAAPSPGTAVKLAGAVREQACCLARLEWESRRSLDRPRLPLPLPQGPFQAPPPSEVAPASPPGVALRPQGVPMCSPRKVLYVCSVTGGQRGAGTALPTLGSL